MKFENTEVWGWQHAIRGMRNPLESWSKSDSIFPTTNQGNFVLGDNDRNLMMKLIVGGAEHRKFLRQIFVSVDITAPLYWWKEFDTYKVGTVANSTSTMHKLTSKPITIDCFETDDYDPSLVFEDGEDETGDTPWDYKIPIDDAVGRNENTFYWGDTLIGFLESLRQRYIQTKDKRIWKELVRWLPESWLQTRTVTMNYENILNICYQRQYHKLNEWSGCDHPELPNFISWARSLPYVEDLLLL